MLLVHTQKLTPRIDYVFKHICTRILGLEISFTSVIEEFIAHTGPKLSYGKQPMGNELFVQSHGLLAQQGIEDLNIVVKPWDDTFCFFSVDGKSGVPFDLFSAAFYLLSRYEEYLPHVKDEYGRYPASESLGFKEGFLRLPVIDQWAYMFKKVLIEYFPEMKFPAKKLRIHNIIEAAVPFAYGQRGPFRSTVGYIRDLLKFRIRKLILRTQVITRLRKDPNDIFGYIIDTLKSSRTPLSVFFLLGEPLFFKDSFNVHREKFKLLIKLVGDYHDVGLIFSTEALSRPELQKTEKRKLEEITHRPLLHAMNDRFLVNLPDIYRNHLELEVARDFTMVYENEVGFRAGTCTPFLFYDLDYEIKTPLTIHPIAMTSAAMEGWKKQKIYDLVERQKRLVKQVNGTFSVVFSNTNFSKTIRNRVWHTLFNERLQEYEEK